LIFGTNFISHYILIFLGIILLIKSLIGLLKDFASWVDFLAGTTFILLIFFSIPWIICLILGGLLVYKGIFSFL